MGGGEPPGRGALRCSGLVTGCWKQKLASDSPPDSCLHMGGNRGPEGLCQPRGCPALATFWTGGHWSAAAPPLAGGCLVMFPGRPLVDVGSMAGLPSGEAWPLPTLPWGRLVLGPPSGPLALLSVESSPPLCHTCPGGGAHSLGFLGLRPGPQPISDAPLLVAPPSSLLSCGHHPVLWGMVASRRGCLGAEP